MAKEVSDIATRLQHELPQRVAAILSETKLETRAQQAMIMNQAIKKLQATIDSCGENLTIFSKLGSAIAELKTAAQQILTSQADPGNSNAPIPALADSLLTLSVLLSEQQSRLSPLLKTLPAVPSKADYNVEALLNASKTNNLQEVERLSKLMPEKSEDAKLAFNMALEHKCIEVAIFWVNTIKVFSQLKFNEFGCPNLSFKLCSNDIYLPVLKAYVTKYKGLGLEKTVIAELTTGIKLNQTFLQTHSLERAHLCTPPSVYNWGGFFIATTLTPCHLSLLTGQAKIVSYLRKLLDESVFATVIPNALMTLIYNIKKQGCKAVPLNQLALALHFVKNSKSTEMPSVLKSLVEKNNDLFTLPPQDDLAISQPLDRIKLLTRYALFYYIFARSSENEYHRDYSDCSPFVNNDDGIKNALAFAEKVSQCTSETDFLTLLHALLTKTHRSTDSHSFRSALLVLLCRFANFFVNFLKVDADRCQDGFPTTLTIDFEKLEPFVACCVRLIKIQLNADETQAFSLHSSPPQHNSDRGTLQHCVSLATHRYFQNNCLEGTVSENGFAKALQFSKDVTLCQDEKAAVNWVASVLSKGQTTAYKENSHLYLIAHAITQNSDLCAKFKISEKTKALTDKNALVKAVAADICTAYNITPATTSLVSSLGGLLKGRAQEKTDASEMQSIQHN
jgi:hypothetical protein